jgi:flagellar motor switch protein FliN/FliY
MMSKTYIKDIRVPVQVILGETNLKVEDIATMGEGSIIELKSLAGEPVDLVVAGEKIAKGEVVVIDENFGLRVTKILDREE